MSNEAAVEAAKPLEYYAANPDALANMTDAQLDALADTPAGPATPVEGDTTGSETPAAASQTQEAAPAAETPAAEQPKGVQTKDGGHIIPYSVLERERDRAARAEATAQALSEQLQQLQAGNASAIGDAGAATLTDEDLAQLEQDLPGVAKTIRALKATIEDLTGTVQAVRQEQDVTRQVEAQSTQDSIGAAIAANPDLLAWHNAKFSAEKPDPRMWDRAADIDAVLREDPDWKDQPISARFAKVAELVKATAPASKPTSTETPQQIQARADAALAAASGTGAVPRSSSDIPGGTAPPTSELAAVLGKSAHESQAHYLSMSPDQIEAELNRLR